MSWKNHMSKTILITGASSGFGEACAKKYAAAGDRLILLARRIDRLERLQSSLPDHQRVHISKVDVTDKQDILTFFKQLPNEFRDIDVLINNAGLALGVKPAPEIDIDDWERMVDTNIKGVFRMTHETLKIMVKRNTGHIINIGSTAGIWPYPGSNVYGATKSFINNFTSGLKADVNGKNIRVSVINPGLAQTEFSNVRLKHDDQAADQVYANTQPLTANDIADIIFWTTSLPQHININALEVMPTCQSLGALNINRDMV